MPSTIAVVVTSALSSGAVSAFVTAALNEGKDARKLRREKIEELYLSASAWLTHTESTFIGVLRVCRGTLTYDQHLDAIVRDGERNPGMGDLHRKMRMTIEMYEQSLLPHLNKLDRNLRAINAVEHRIREQYRRSGEASEHLSRFNAHLIDLGKAGDALKAAIVDRGVVVGRDQGSLSRLASRASASIRARLSGWRSLQMP